MKKQINEIGRTCSRCNEFKNWPEYYKHKSRNTGYSTACKSCLGQEKYTLSYTIEEFLEQRIDKSKKNSCWNWTGPKNKAGYGTIGNPWKQKFGTPFAHRISYIVNQGPIEKNKLICHKCDNPSCVNPNHLYEGTHQDNVDDKMKRGRYKGPNRKLTDDQVREIEKLYNKGHYQTEIAKIYKISQKTVWNIINKKSYKDV